MGYLTLRDIFTLDPNISECSIQMLLDSELAPSFKTLMAQKLYLTYKEIDHSTGNVCFANNQTLSTEYRTTFNKQEIIYYILSFHHLTPLKINLDIRFPEKDVDFWTGVSEGKSVYTKVLNN